MAHPRLLLGDRFARVGFADGAVLVDFQSGAFYALHGAADRVAVGLAQGQEDGPIAQGLADEFGIPLAQAAEDVQSLRSQLDAPADAPTVNPVTFRADSNAHTLCWQGEPVWRIEPAANRLVRLAEPTAETDLVTELLWCVPHILLLAGRFVLHASAVRLGAAATAFCGPSGVGKTTLARTLVAQGGLPVAEDLLVVDLRAGLPTVQPAAEPFLRRWAAVSAPRAAYHGIDIAPIVSWAEAGEPVPLAAICLPERSSAAGLISDPLGPTAAYLLLLQNSFAELGTREVWRRLLHANARLVDAAAVSRLLVPDGLSALDAAAAAYMRTVKS